MLANPESYYNRSVPANTLTNAALRRMATAADIEVTRGKVLNMQTIKALTGNDTADGGMRVTVTVVATMNTLYSVSSKPEHVRADIIRRVSVIPTLLQRESEDIDVLPIDKSSLEELARLMIIKCLRYSMPPLDQYAVLLTIYQGRFKDLEGVLEPYDDASLGEGMAATIFRRGSKVI